jgi:hypothetical protein
MKLVRRTFSPLLPNETRYCATDWKSVVHLRICRISKVHSLRESSFGESNRL